MEFSVPQFIEREPRIVGPWTFKEFIYIAIAGGISIYLYFKLPLFLFLMGALVLVGLALVMIYYKPNGIALPTVIKNFFNFLTQSRIFLWQKKETMSKISLADSKEIKKEQETEKTSLKIGGKSRLKDLVNYLETR